MTAWSSSLVPVRPSKRGWKSERLSRYTIHVTYHTAAPALIYMYSSCVHHTHTHTHTHVKKMTFSCNLIEVMCTWQSQDACALSRHCEPCKQSSWSWAWNSQENRHFLTASGVGTQSPTGLLLFQEKRPWIFIPANVRYPITAGWTGGAGGRQMEN